MLIIVRHGRTAANAAGLLLGRADPELDDEGVAQAKAVAEWIGPVDRVVTSPLSRARQTAEAFGVDAMIDDRWIELDYGALEGQTVSGVPESVWRQWREDPDFIPAGGESLGALNRRVWEACEDLVAAARTADVVVVTHVSPIKAFLPWALGADSGISWRTRVSQPSITRIAIGPNGPVLHGFNEAPR